MKVLGFGDNIVDKYEHEHIMYPGGNALNFAVFAKRLGIEAAYMGVFAKDKLGRMLRHTLRDLGIDTSHSTEIDGECGYTEVEIVEGDRVFVGGNAGGVSCEKPLVLSDADLAYMREFAIIHSSCYSKSEAELPKLATMPGIVTYDFSSDADFRADTYLREVCPHIDFALFSDDQWSRGEIQGFMRYVASLGPTYVLVTRNLNGSILYDGKSFYEGTVERVDPVDTMGAGDSFLTAFLLTLLSGGWNRKVNASAECITLAFAKAAHFSAQNCLVKGAFGHGVRY